MKISLSSQGKGNRWQEEMQRHLIKDPNIWASNVYFPYEKYTRVLILLKKQNVSYSLKPQIKWNYQKVFCWMIWTFLTSHSRMGNALWLGRLPWRPAKRPFLGRKGRAIKRQDSRQIELLSPLPSICLLHSWQGYWKRLERRWKKLYSFLWQIWRIN